MMSPIPRIPRRVRRASVVVALLLIGTTTPNLVPAHAGIVSGPSEGGAEVATARVALAPGVGGRGQARRAGVLPFEMIGLHYTAPAPGEARVRVRWQGDWTPWMPLEVRADDAPDDDDATVPVDSGLLVRSEPLWVDQADAYELDLPAGAAGAKVHLVREVGVAVAAVAPEGAAEPATVGTAADGGGASQPPMLLRAAWGARTQKVSPTIAPSLDLAVVHHTATGGQSYLASDVPAILRGLQAFHMDANGWDDIAYNFVVDRFGRIWEARAGGISRAVQGGHAKGFNQRSVGVVVLGDFRTDAISTAAVNAVGDLLGWKLFLHGVEPTAQVRRISDDNPRFPEGAVVTLDAVAGHGDTGYTSCPGDHLRAQLGRIRSRAASIVAASRGSGTFAARAVSMGIVAVPLRGDFDGDGRGDVFWYGPGAEADEVWYGRADGTFTSVTVAVTGTYTPLAGDFDHDGRTDLFFYAPGPATDSIWYGAVAGFSPTRTSVTGTYQPVTGDFDGDLRTDVLWYGAEAAPDSLWLAEPGRRWTYKVTSVAGTYAPVVGDFDQDDRSDVLWYGSGAARDGLWLGGSDGFRTRSASVPYVATPLVGDFAGGPGQDVLWYGVGAAADALWVSGVTGGFTTRAVTVSGTYRPVVADVDGGGRDDILWYGPGGGSDSLWRARGDGTFTTSKPTMGLDAVGIALDGDGDGMQDVLWYGAGSAPDGYSQST